MSSIQFLIVGLVGGVLGSSILRTGNEQLRVAETKLDGAADNKATTQAATNQSIVNTFTNVTAATIDATSPTSVLFPIFR